MLTTISEGTRRPDRIVVIDNGNVYLQGDIQPDEFSGLYDDWMIQPKNLGVAGSCNLAMKIAAEQPGGYWLHANDDIEVSKGAVVDLEYGATVCKDELMICPAHNAGSAFTFFLMPAQKAIDEIGWWDEAFFPAYFEDNDYAYRMGLKGYKHVDVAGGTYIHHTSSTKKAYTGTEETWGHERFRANRQRYIDKWAPDVKDNGDPIYGTEKFNTPFGLKLEEEFV
jgi:GT2 family glycosyltransferase